MRHLRLLLFLMFGCSPSSPPAAPTPEPPAVEDTDFCDEAEAKLEELGCRDRRGDPMWVNRNGERFAATCQTIQDEGGVFLDPKCIANAKTCEEAMSCPANQ